MSAYDHRYNVERGYGFIAVDGGGPDMYVHATGLLTDKPLKDGDQVRFITEIDKRTNKPKAVDVEFTGQVAPSSGEPAQIKTALKKEATVSKIVTKTSSTNPNQRALLEAKLQNDEAARESAKRMKLLQYEKLHRALLGAKLKNDEAAKESAKAAAEAAEKARIAAEEAKKARLAKEAEEKRLAEEAEKARIAAEEAEKARLAEEAEKARLAKEAEEKRLAEEAEKARIAAEEAEKARLAAEAAAAEEASLKKKALDWGCDDVETYKARTAHLDETENAKLDAKYSAISDLGERLFTILVDLKMIDIHLDPDDPNVVIEDDDDDDE